MIYTDEVVFHTTPSDGLLNKSKPTIVCGGEGNLKPHKSKRKNTCFLLNKYIKEKDEE